MTALEFTQQMPQLRFLPALQLIRLAEQSSLSELAPRQPYHATLLPNAPCLYLQEGGLSLQPAAESQAPPVPQLVFSRTWINLSASLVPSAPAYAVQAFTNSRIVAIPRAVLLNAARKNPDLSYHLAEACAAEAQWHLQWHQAMLSKSAEGRVAYLIARLHRQYAHADTFAPPLEQAQLAQLVGCSREVFSRSLAGLSRKGCIVRQGHQISVLSPDDLEHIP